MIKLDPVRIQCESENILTIVYRINDKDSIKLTAIKGPGDTKQLQIIDSSLVKKYTDNNHKWRLNVNISNKDKLTVIITPSLTTQMTTAEMQDYLEFSQEVFKKAKQLQTIINSIVTDVKANFNQFVEDAQPATFKKYTK